MTFMPMPRPTWPQMLPGLLGGGAPQAQLARNLWDTIEMIRNPRISQVPGGPPVGAGAPAFPLGGGMLAEAPRLDDGTPPVRSVTRPAPAAPIGPVGPMPFPDSPNPVAAPKQSLWARLQGAILPAPPGAQGLLSDDDVSAARRQAMLAFGGGLLEAGGPTTGVAPSLGQALGRGLRAGQETYQSAIGGALQLQELTAKREAERQRAVARQQAAATLNDPSLTPEQRFAAAQRLTATAYGLGDTGSVGALSQLANAAKPDTPAPARPIEMDLGGERVLVDPATQQILQRFPKTAAPRDPNAANGVADQRAFQRENTLAENYARATGDKRDALDQIRGSLRSVPAAVAGDGAAQIDLLYSFVKSLDPGSVAREGELALAQSAAPLYAQAQAYVSRYAQGDRSFKVPPQLLRQMATLMEQRADGYARSINTRREEYLRRARRAGVPDPDAIFQGVELAAPPATVPARGRTASAAAAAAAAGAPASTGTNPFLR